MLDQSNLTRQWLLLRKLCSLNSQWTLQELASNFKVSQKTISRDLNKLSNFGFPLTEQVGAHGRKSWTCNTDCLLSGLSFTFEEAASLFLSRRFLELMAGTVFFDAAHSAFRKIESGLPKKTLQFLEQLATTFHQTSLGASNYQDRGDTINALLTAIEDLRVTKLLYYSMSSEAPGDRLGRIQSLGLELRHEGSGGRTRRVKRDDYARPGSVTEGVSMRQVTADLRVATTNRNSSEAWLRYEKRSLCQVC
ncbi:HTH domain-containing protein [bacterium]|nr:HTH domain-containing protein [bacterium]